MLSGADALRDLAELVRVPAALSVPGDVAAGAVAAGVRTPRVVGLASASVLLYWAGMAGNDWADRRLDAVERPERPVPSGRVSPAAAFWTSAGLTAAGLALAGLAGGRRSLAVAAPLAGAVWAYDLVAKNGPVGPAVMAACRGLDVLLGASLGGPGSMRAAVPAAATVAAHTWTVTTLSRREVSGAPRWLPVATLGGTVAVAAAAAAPRLCHPDRLSLHGYAVVRGQLARPSTTTARSRVAGRTGHKGQSSARTVAVLPAVLAGWYVARFGVAQARAATDPTASRVRAAVGAGITSLPALQGALVARAGAGVLGLAVAAAVPLGRRLARWISPT